MFASLFSYSKVDENNDKHDMYEEMDESEIYLKNCIYEDEHVSFYQTDARDFLPYIYNADFQRSVDQDHVDKLTQELKVSNHCVGTFKAVIDINKKVKLIDGQHRVLALYENMKQDPQFNMILILEVYPSNNEIEQREYFRRANNVKNFEPEELPTINIAEMVIFIIKALKLKFEESIVTMKITEKKKIMRPRVDEQELTNAITKYINVKNDINQTIIYQQIIDLNSKLGLKKFTFFKKNNVSELMWNRAKKTAKAGL